MGSEPKRLLCTTDDLGMCHAVNEGVELALSKGWARAGNFLAPAPWFRDAVGRVKGRGWDVGVHLCLTCDWDRLGWGPLTANPRLKTPLGTLPARHEGLLELGATDADLYDELKAQISLVKKTYGEPSHLDSHMLGGQWRGGIHDRVQAVIGRLSLEFGLSYTYARDPGNGRLLHFRDEDCHSGWDRGALLAKLDAWTAPGAYHLFGHAAVDSAELGALCSVGHPSRRWARDVRVSDLTLYLDPSLPGEFERRGFRLAGVAEVLGA